MVTRGKLGQGFSKTSQGDAKINPPEPLKPGGTVLLNPIRATEGDVSECL